MKQITWGSTNLRRSTQESEARAPVGYWLSILVLCLLPLERWSLPFNLRIVDLALVLLTLYGFGKAWVMNGRLHVPLAAPFWLILVASLIAMTGGFADTKSAITVVQEVYLFVWFISFTNVLAALPLSKLDKLMKFWSALAIAEATTTLMGMLGIGPSIFFTSPDAGRILSSAGMNRAIGTYINPNAAASYLSIGFFVLWATSWRIRLRLLLGLWLLAGILATGSMGALGSTIVCFTALLMLYSSKKHRRATAAWVAASGVGAAVIIALLMVFSLRSSSSSMLKSITEAEPLSLTVGRFARSQSGRSDLIQNTWPAYLQHPLGLGPSGGAVPAGGLHNDYVAFLFERGPFGVLGWLWLLGSTLLTPLRVAYRCTDGHKRWQSLTLAAGFLACALNALSHEIFHFRQVWALMAFVFAVSYALAAHLDGDAKPSQRYQVRKI